MNLFLETVENSLHTYISIIYIYFPAYFEELRRLNLQRWHNCLSLSLTCPKKFKYFTNIYDFIPITFTVFFSQK